MAQTPYPTPYQVRQHALDRALQPDVVRTLGEMPDPGTTGLSELGFRESITSTAQHFADWLMAAEEPPVQGAAMLGLATTRDLILELYTRGKIQHHDVLEGAMRHLVKVLEEDETTLNYRPVD